MQVSTSISAGARSQGDTKRAVFPVGHMVLFSLVTVLFFLWGMSNNLTDILVQQFKKSFELSPVSAQLVQTANFFGYFCMAIPAALLNVTLDSAHPVQYATAYLIKQVNPRLAMVTHTSYDETLIPEALAAIRQHWAGLFQFGAPDVVVVNVTKEAIWTRKAAFPDSSAMARLS